MMKKMIRSAGVDQITAFIQGFVQLWIKYEALLQQELVKQKLNIQSGKNNEIQTDINLGLFYRVSSSIYPRNDVTMGELSALLSVPLSTATRIVNCMVSSNYIKRLPDPDDRRIVRVALTETGLEFHRAIENYTKEHVHKVLSNLTLEEQTLLFKILDKVLPALKRVAS